MTDARPMGRTRRFALLMGLLLHLVSAAAVPLFHSPAPAPAPVAGAALDRHADPRSERGLAGHDEVHCLLCHAAGQTAVPPDGPTAPVGEPPHAVAYAEPHAFAPPRPARASQARAPPHA